MEIKCGIGILRYGSYKMRKGRGSGPFFVAYKFGMTSQWYDTTEMSSQICIAQSTSQPSNQLLIPYPVSGSKWLQTLYVLDAVDIFHDPFQIGR